MWDEHKKMRRIKNVESTIRTIGIYANIWQEMGGIMKDKNSREMMESMMQDSSGVEEVLE